MNISSQDTALVVTDPQNDVLSEKGAAWGLVGDGVQKIGTVEHLDLLFSVAKSNGYDVVISPHYSYPTDQGWRFGGPIEQMMHETGMFARSSALSVEGFEGSGADWLEQYKKYIDDGETVVTSPHKVFGPESNDLVLQLRKLGKAKVILAGMLGNLCVESHLRELVEQGFEVAVVKDATAAPNHPHLGDGYPGAVANFGFVANAVLTTDETVAAMGAT
jgi:nicotinamidase-related amidase